MFSFYCWSIVMYRKLCEKVSVILWISIKSHFCLFFSGKGLIHLSFGSLLVQLLVLYSFSTARITGCTTWVTTSVTNRGLPDGLYLKINTILVTATLLLGKLAVLGNQLLVVIASLVRALLEQGSVLWRVRLERLIAWKGKRRGVTQTYWRVCVVLQ